MKYLYTFILSVATIVLIWLNVRLYIPAEPEVQNIVAQLEYLEEGVHGDAPRRMQGLFPEGFVFTHAIYGLAWTDLGLRAGNDTALRNQALRESRYALSQIESSEGKEVFDISLSPPYGLFYNGWLNRLRGGILQLMPAAERDSSLVTSFTEGCDELAQTFITNRSPFPESYPGQCWPADAAVAMSALRMHDRLFSPRYDTVITAWIARAYSHADTSGLLPHHTHPLTGDALQGPRGSSQTLILWFLFEIDSTLAQSQYKLYRDRFISSILWLPGVREYPKGASGDGDVDSGPVIFGLGGTSTVMGLGLAYKAGDRTLAEPLAQCIETSGVSLSFGDRKRYFFGALPVMDAFIAWSRCCGLNTPSQSQNYESITPIWWRIPIGILTMGIMAFLWWLRLKPKSGNPTPTADNR